MGFSWGILLPHIVLLLTVNILLSASVCPVKLPSSHLAEPPSRQRHALRSSSTDLTQKQSLHKEHGLPPKSKPQQKHSPLQSEALKKKKKKSQPSSTQKGANQTGHRTNTTITRHMGTPPTGKNSLSISTTSGRYLGFTNSSSRPVETWLAIRYAKPPIGYLRFRAPVFFDKPPDDDGEVKEAYGFGDACPQPPFDPPLDVDISEDCLYLNVYRPERQNQVPLLPVLVWIHGGGLSYGTAASVDGADIVSSSVDLRKPVIFVSLNYRLNSFGFLNTDHLPVEDLQVGLKDQITCLKWLKLNIHAFGGDPDKITIWGQSAGAFSVSLLTTFLHNTRNSNLFRAAIMDSGSPTTHTVPAVGVYDREGLPYNLLLQATGCNDSYRKKRFGKARLEKDDPLECLRELDYDVLLHATMSITGNLPFSRQVSVWGPSHKDGSLIGKRPSQKLANNEFLRIPMILGTNKDEGTLAAVGPSFGYRSSSDHPDVYFRSYMMNSSILDFESVDSEVFENVLELYPNEPSFGSPFGTGNDTFGLPRIFKRLAAWFGDLHYQAPRRLWAYKASLHQDVYVYYFDGPPPSNVHPYAGVSHSSELPLIFGNSEYEDLPASEIKATNELARRMRNRYISFVYELNPGDDWPAYKPTEHQVMRFNKQIPQGEIIEDNWREKQLGYLNSEAAINTYMT